MNSKSLETDERFQSSFLVCLRRLDSSSYEVMQLEFEVDNVINLVPTQTLHWTVEYPAGVQTTSRQTEKVSHLYISNADIQGIVPLAEVTPTDKCRYWQLWENILTHLAGHISSLLLLLLLLTFLLTPPLPSPNTPWGLIKAVKVILFTPSCGDKPPGQTHTHTHTAGFLLSQVFKIPRRRLNGSARSGGCDAYRRARTFAHRDPSACVQTLSHKRTFVPAMQRTPIHARMLSCKRSCC